MSDLLADPGNERWDVNTMISPALAEALKAAPEGEDADTATEELGEAADALSSGRGELLSGLLATDGALSQQGAGLWAAAEAVCVKRVWKCRRNANRRRSWRWRGMQCHNAGCPAAAVLRPQRRPRAVMHSALLWALPLAAHPCTLLLPCLRCRAGGRRACQRRRLAEGGRSD